MLPPYYFYWFRIDTKHMTELWLYKALMDSAYYSELDDWDQFYLCSLIMLYFLLNFLHYIFSILKPTTYIQNCIYMNFRINLTQFYINFSRQEHQIDVLYVSFNAWDSQVSSYTLFHFPYTLYSPINNLFK